MTEQLIHLDLIERYENGLMTPHEQEMFQVELEQDALLKQEYQLYKSLVSGIKNHYSTLLKKKLQELDKTLPDPKSAKIITLHRPVVWMAAACTSLILAAGIYLINSNQSSETGNSIAHYSIDDPGLPVLMSNTNSQLKQQAEAMNFYHTGQFRKALSTWNQIPSDAIGPDTIAYYKGIFLMKLGKYDSANVFLTPLISSNSTFSDRAEYYTALNFWQQHHIKQAKQLLEHIKANPSHDYNDLATQILNEKEFKN